MPDSKARETHSPLVKSAALEALSARLRPALLEYFRRRVNDAAESEELVHEVFTRMLRRGDVAAVEDARGYLFETASSVLIDRARRLEARQRASAALLELSERTRTIFVLRRLENMKYPQIARLLGLSVRAAEKHMMRAVAHLTARVNNI